MIRRLFFLSFMMGAIGVPYLLSSSSDMWSGVKARFRNDGEKKAPAADATTKFGATQQAPGGPASGFSAPSGKPQDIVGFPAHDLTEVLHFNGTPDWVTARWPRVTTGLAHPNLQGYRVPLVTGTAENDLAGSLTYYFDGERHVKFITFHGVTGDPRKIIALVVQKYGLKPEPTDDPSTSLYLVKWNGKPLSELVVRTAPVLRADQPHNRYNVDLALKRP